MPTVFLPWGEFLPDLGKYRTLADNVASLVLGSENALSVSRGFMSLPFPGVLTNSAISTGAGINPVTWCKALPQGPGTYLLYAGDQAKLYEYDPAAGGPVTDVSKAGGYTGEEWFGTVFGEDVIATNGVEPVQLKLAAGALFEDCFDAASPSKPLAKYVCPFRQHALFGNYTDGANAVPHGVWWTALNNVRLIGTAEPTSLPGKNSGKQPLGDDLGHVTQVADRGEYALILRESGVTRMDGLPASFRNIELSRGTIYSRSVAALGPYLYFLGQGAVLRCDGREVVDIGTDAVNRLLFDTTFSPYPVSDDPNGTLGVYGAADPSAQVVAWTWRSGSEMFTVLYHEPSQRFSLMRMPTSASFDGTYWRGLTRRPFPGGAWAPLGELAFIYETDIGGVQSYFFGQFDNSIHLTNKFHTGFIQLDEERRALVRKVRPIYHLRTGVSTQPFIRVGVLPTNAPYDPTGNPVTSVDQDRDGAFVFGTGLAAGDFNAFQVQFGTDDDADPADLGVGEYEGVEVDYELEGTR